MQIECYVVDMALFVSCDVYLPLVLGLLHGMWTFLWVPELVVNKTIMEP